MIRIATAGLRVTDLLINPNRGQLFEIACVIDSPEDALSRQRAVPDAAAIDNARARGDDAAWHTPR